MNPEPVLAALADATRRAVFERLTTAGPATATHLADHFPVSRQAITKHLATLDAAGLVERHIEGRSVIYSARIDPLADVTAWMDQVGTAWDHRLKRLRDTF